MSIQQRMKIMKKLLYGALALAGIFAVSCNKEKDVTVSPELTGKTHTVVLKASFVEEGGTRTTYADNKTFSWQEGDIAMVRVANEETEKWYWAPFTAQSTAAVTEFVGEVEDGYEPYDMAVYVPGESFVSSMVYDGSTVSIVVPISYHLDGYGLGEDEKGNATPYWNSVSVSSENPLAALSLVSTVKDDELYFQTGMGVLNVNLTDVDPTATHIRIATAGKYLGNYLMVKDAQISNESPYVDEEEGQTYSTSYMEYYFEPVGDGKVSLMIPMPVGTLPAGSAIAVFDADNNILFSRTFSKDVVVERNKILTLAPLKAKDEWVSLGTGKFGDHYYFNPNYDVDVEIQRNAANPNEYRLVNPYAPYLELAEYEATGDEYGPDPYFVFRVLKKGERVGSVTVTHDDLVYFEDFYTGRIDDDYGVDAAFIHPSAWSSFTENDWLRSIVVKYQADGVTPANIQLAPVVYWLTDPDEGSGYWTSGNYLNENNLIEIRFPGAERIDLDASVSFAEMVDSAPEQSIALVAFEHSSVITEAKIVIAADAADAAAALADASRYTVATEAGEYEVLLPANAPSGDYYVYAQTAVSGDVTPACAQLLVSKSFKYFNPEDDKGYQLEDVIGSYSMNNYYYLNGWRQTTMTMTVEESDDPLAGDIMITRMCPELIQNYGAVTFTGAVYAYFNTATGEIEIPGGQIFATAAGAEWYLTEYSQGEPRPLHALLTEPGKILNEGNYCFGAYLNGENYGIQFYVNGNSTFVRTSGSAPALAPASLGGNAVVTKESIRAFQPSFARARVPFK